MNTKLFNERIFEAAKECGFERTESCCGIENKSCTNDRWKGDLAHFVRYYIHKHFPEVYSE